MSRGRKWQVGNPAPMTVVMRGNVIKLKPEEVERELPRVVELVTPKVVDRSAEIDPELLRMLTYMRPGDSKAELAFIGKYVFGLKAPDGVEYHGPLADAYNNYYYIVGDGRSPMMWSCHTDTVHHANGRQDVVLAPDGTITQQGGNCLGADDGAGVYIMRRMIQAGVPGLYVFHRAEETGCEGSKWATRNNWELYAASAVCGYGVKAAVAFDRKDCDEIITHQSGMRGCSDKFAQSLGDAIGLGHKPSSKGVYTDTKEYVNIVGECTNIGVGYKWQHGPKEEQNGVFLMQLAKAMCEFNESKLVFERVQGAAEEARASRTTYTSVGNDGYYDYRQSYKLKRGDVGYQEYADPRAHWIQGEWINEKGEKKYGVYVHEDDMPEYVWDERRVDYTHTGSHIPSVMYGHYRRMTPDEKQRKMYAAVLVAMGLPGLPDSNDDLDEPRPKAKIMGVLCDKRNTGGDGCLRRTGHDGVCAFTSKELAAVPKVQSRGCNKVYRWSDKLYSCLYTAGHKNYCSWMTIKRRHDAAVNSCPNGFTDAAGDYWHCENVTGHPGNHTWVLDKHVSSVICLPHTEPKPQKPEVEITAHIQQGREFDALVAMCRDYPKAVEVVLEDIGESVWGIKETMKLLPRMMAQRLELFGVTAEELQEYVKAGLH